MAEFLKTILRFFKEVIVFGLDAFIIAISREIMKRFWKRLNDKGGINPTLQMPQETQERTPNQSPVQHTVQPQQPLYQQQQGMSFLDEYMD